MSYFPLKDFFESWYLCRICVNSRIQRNVGLFCTLDGKRYEYFAYCPSFKVFKPRCDKLSENIAKDYPTRYFFIVYIIIISSLFFKSLILCLFGFIVLTAIIIVNTHTTPSFARKHGWFPFLYVTIMKYVIDNQNYELFETSSIIKQQIYKLYGYNTMSSFLNAFKTIIPNTKEQIKKYEHKIDERQKRRIFALVCQVCSYNNIENFRKTGIVEEIHKLLKLQADALEMKEYFMEKEQEIIDQQNYEQNYKKYNSKIISISNEDSYFEILGLTTKATNAEISKKFRQLALLYHPDRFTNKPEYELKQAQEKFKEITFAYNQIKNIRNM